MERNLGESTSSLYDTMPEARVKPAIASLAKTAKLVYMSKRPQPPAKYRSDIPIPSPSRRSHKKHIYSQGSDKMTKLNVKTDESLGKESIDSGQSVHMKSSKTSSKILQGVSVSSKINSVKSVAELLEEAQEIAGVLPRETVQQRAPKKTTSEKNKKLKAHEIVTPLQSQYKVGYLSSSIQINKKLNMRDMIYTFIPDEEVNKYISNSQLQ